MTLILSYTPAGAPGGHPTLPEAVADLRRDLFDRARNLPTDAPPRWSDDDLERALDRAVDEYSRVTPLIQAVMTATLPRTRSYAFPAGAWWIERVEYPTGLYPPRFVPFEEGIMPGLGAPATAPSAAASGIAGPLTGAYSWSVTFVNSGGETSAGPASPPLALAGGSALVGAIPLGPPGTVGRAIYRSRAGAVPARVGLILDNSTTSLLDAAPDTAVGAPPATDTTANLEQFTLKLAPGRLPADTSGILTVTYACKHTLSPAGTSVPEEHHDVVLLGAAAYAMLAYQAPTNDLFEYQDGELRDRVDERTVPQAWLGAGAAALKRFHDRLDEIKSQRNAGAAAVAQWGDVPLRWQRT